MTTPRVHGERVVGERVVTARPRLAPLMSFRYPANPIDGYVCAHFRGHLGQIVIPFPYATAALTGLAHKIKELQKRQRRPDPRPALLGSNGLLPAYTSIELTSDWPSPIQVSFIHLATLAHVAEELRSGDRSRPEPLSLPEPEVSLVIPCLNEERTLGVCIDRALAAFAEAKISGEVVVADNGSTDGSIEIAQQHGARVVRAGIKGYGSALRRGIEAAHGEFIIMGDADGSHDFSEIPRFVTKWREGYEFVVGNRFSGEIKGGAMSWHHRHLGTPVLSALLNLFFRAGIEDINCGMRGITRELAGNLSFRTTGMEFASESLIKAAKYGAHFAEVPITMWPDQRNRPPHLRTFRDGWRHLRYILLCAPNWLFLFPGGSLVALGIGFVLWLLPGPRLAGRIGLDLHTISLSMMLVLLGVHIISIGLFVKVFCYTEKLSRNQPSLGRWLKRVKLEHGLLLGVGLALAGFGGDMLAFWQWGASGFGQFHAVRTVFFCSLSLFVGVQILFSSVFLSMLGISRATYIGD